jgi:hypothetical protein
MDRKRPGGLLAIAIVAITLGVLGTCGGLSTIASSLAHSEIQALSRDMVDASSMGNEALRQQQLALQDSVEALTERWRPALLAHQVLNLIASLALLAGAIQLLRWRPGALMLFAAAAIASIAVDIGGGVIQILYQQATSALMRDYAAGLTAATPGALGDRTVGAVMQASAVTGLVMAVGWVVVKLGFYSASLVYTRRADVRALFTRT